MEKLFVFALLSSVGYEKLDEYTSTLDSLFLSNPQDEFLLDLEGREHKDAMLHLLHRMNEMPFDTHQFGRFLMSQIGEIYAATDNLEAFSKSMYELWQRLPGDIGEENPFHILSYADDPLSWGDENQCRSLYEEAFNYYTRD